MKKLTQEELNEIIESHVKWLDRKWSGEKADLSYKNLSGLDLCKATLTGANFTGATLTGAILRNATLDGAILTNADLYGADLTMADLTGADLTNAILTNADLRYANLTDANLTEATLTGADLTRANLIETTLTNATLPDFQIPKNEDLVVWKLLKDYCNGEEILCKLLIPAGLERTASLIGNKCRAASAKVLEFQDMDGNVLDMEKVVHRTYSGCQFIFTYTKGAMAIPDGYNSDIRLECTHGIHFFMTREEAKSWVSQ